MNIEQLKRNDLNIANNVKYFAKALMGDDFCFGPASLSDLLTEAFLSADESFAAQAWFATLGFLSKYNVEFRDINLSNQVFSENERVKGYTRLIKEIFKSFKENDVTLAFFVNHRKWSKKIMNELAGKHKAKFYALDAYFAKELNNLGYTSMNAIFKEESLKVKTMTTSYYAFINDDQKND